jgi:hypothetical protein
MMTPRSSRFCFIFLARAAALGVPGILSGCGESADNGTGRIAAQESEYATESLVVVGGAPVTVTATKSRWGRFAAAFRVQGHADDTVVVRIQSGGARLQHVDWHGANRKPPREQTSAVEQLLVGQLDGDTSHVAFEVGDTAVEVTVSATVEPEAHQQQQAFVPGKCGGASLTLADATRRLGGAAEVVLADFDQLARSRECHRSGQCDASWLYGSALVYMPWDIYEYPSDLGQPVWEYRTDRSYPMEDRSTGVQAVLCANPQGPRIEIRQKTTGLARFSCALDGKCTFRQFVSFPVFSVGGYHPERPSFPVGTSFQAHLGEDCFQAVFTGSHVPRPDLGGNITSEVALYVPRFSR